MKTINHLFIFPFLFATIIGCGKGKTTDQESSPPDLVTPDRNPPQFEILQAQSNSYVSAQKIKIHGTCSDESSMIVEVISPTQAFSECFSGAWEIELDLSAENEGAISLVVQAKDIAGNIAPEQRVSLIKDTVAPSAVVLANPVQTPFMSSGDLVLSGTCESESLVKVSGDESFSSVCTEGAFQVSISKTSDSAYRFSITQTDLAGNESPAITQEWIRNSAGIVPPRVLVPQASPTYTHSDSLTISGECQSGYLVSISGGASQVCTDSGFSFVIGKTSDGHYAFDLQQSFAGMSSATARISWVRDTVAPALSLELSSPFDKNFANFEFQANESSALTCQIDSGSWVPCALSTSVPNQTFGARSFSVMATDLAGNTSTASHAWNHFKTIGLYHFDGAAGDIDSSLNGISIVNSGAQAGVAGKYSQAFKFDGVSSFATVPTNSSLEYMKDGFTFETSISLTSRLSSKKSKVIIASHSGGSGDLGWTLALKRVGRSYFLSFVTSADGVVQTTEILSDRIPKSPTAGQWYHAAVSFDPHAATKSVKFYWGRTSGTLVSEETMPWTPGARQFISMAGIRLGRTEMMNTSTSAYFHGMMDEVRISEGIRTVGELTGGPYTVTNPAD